MGLNKNHEVEDFNGVKCAVVEKGISQERADFLKKILEFNNYEVHIVDSAPPKAPPVAKPVSSEIIDPTTATATAAAAATPTAAGTPTAAAAAAATPTAAATATATATNDTPPAPSLYNVGVTDLLFNPINAIFGRLLKSTDGHIVTLAYWHQKEVVSQDEIPYFEKR